MSLKESLQQPCPWHPSIKGKMIRAVFFGLFVVIFLLVFQPFDLDFFPANRLIWVALAYGAITFGCIAAITAITPLLFPATFNEKVWTTGRQIAFMIFIIFVLGLINFLFAPLLVDTRLTLQRAIWFQGITVAIALLPVTIFNLLRQNQLLKKFRKQAADIEEQLRLKLDVAEQQVPLHQPSPALKILFTGDYKGDDLELFTDDVHMITSANNYIKIYYLRHNRLIYSILRSTMKKSEETTLPYSNLFKCHRAFIINLDKVVHVEGNAQGYKLRIEGYDDLIPVSRNLSAEFSDKLLAYREKMQF